MEMISPDYCDLPYNYVCLVIAHETEFFLEMVRSYLNGKKNQ